MTSNFKADDPAGYELMMGRWSRQLAVPFLDFVALAPNAAVVDVGCGTGSLAQVLLPALGRGSITGVDVSPAFIAHARAAVGDPRASFEVADATALGFADNQFDAALSLLVLNFVTDPIAAVRQMIRVTKPGGIVAAAVWDFEGGLQMTRMIWDTLAAINPAAERGRARSCTWPLTHEGELAAAFQAEGAREVETRDLLVWIRFTSFDDYWTPFLKGQGPIGAFVASLSNAEREQLHALMRAAYCAGRADGPRAYAGVARTAKGRTPG